MPTVEPVGFVSGGTAVLTVRSPLGTLTGLLFGTPGDRLSIAGVLGDLWLDPRNLCTPLVGIQNGNLSWSVAIPPSPMLFGQPWHWQALAVLQGTVVLGALGSAVLR